MLNAAITLAREGFRVFPLIPNGKKPLRKGWQQWATSDINFLLDEWPVGECNVGIATGHDFFVLDVDPKRGGISALESLEAANGKFPATYRVRTASGGLHLYFRIPPGIFMGNSVDLVAPGIDVRGVGGLVVGAGSKVNGGYYERIG